MLDKFGTWGFSMFVGFVAIFFGISVLLVIGSLFELDMLHWFILGAIACYYVGKFIRERTGM